MSKRNCRWSARCKKLDSKKREWRLKTEKWKLQKELLKRKGCKSLSMPEPITKQLPIHRQKKPRPSRKS